MLSFGKPRTLLVDQGRVMCPQRGDIDVECCYGCQWLRSIDLDAGEPSLKCEAIERGFAGSSDLILTATR